LGVALASKNAAGTYRKPG